MKIRVFFVSIFIYILLSFSVCIFFQVKHFSSFVGTDGQGRGEVLGKKMAEQIMTRELMTKMSWTGVSRTAGFDKKFAFQTLEHLVKLFHKVLAKADSRWSYEKNEKLFSGALLKHAKKRAIAEQEKFEKKKKQTQANSFINASNSPLPAEMEASENEILPQEPPPVLLSNENGGDNGREDSNENGDGEE